MDSASTHTEEAKKQKFKEGSEQMLEETPELENFVRELNTTFYRCVSQSFSQTRLRPWNGWEQILREIEDVFDARNHYAPADALSIIDFGCGNGRFGSFLQNELSFPIRYVGIDNNITLLEEAKTKLSGQEFEVADLTSPLELAHVRGDMRFDIAACFGVLHHLYGEMSRVDLLDEMLSALKSPGLVCLSFWQPLKNTRYLEQSQRNIGILRRAHPHTPFDAFGAHDLLLSWQERRDVFRFVHSFTKQEIAEFLANATSMYPDVKIRSIFKTNAGNDTNNTYAILQKG